MALIDDIVAKVEALPVQGDGSIILDADAFSGVDFAPLLFTQVLNTTSLTIAGATRTTPPGSATLAGTATVFGYADIGVTITFSAANDQVTISVDGTFAPGKSVTLPIVDWIAIGNIGIASAIAQPYSMVTFTFHASIILQGDSAPTVPITLTPQGTSGWHLTVDEGASQGLSGAQLVTLLGSNSLTSFLPQDLVDILAGFELNGIDTVFDITAKTVSSFTIGITVTNGWDILPQFSLAPGMSISFLATNITDPSSRTLVGVVKSTFVVGGVPVPIFVQGSVDSSAGTAWSIGLDPESTGVTLPSLSNLFDLSNDPTFKSSLPSGLANLPGINIFELQVDFTTGPATLQRIAFGAQTTSSWPVIDGFLTIDALSFEMDLLNLSDTANRQIGVNFASRFSVADTAWLYFTITKDPTDPDWVLAGGLQKGVSLNFTDLVAKLLSSYVTIPASAPQIVIDQADITVIPGKSMNFTAGSNTPWTLIAGKLTLDSFTLALNYVSGTPQSTFTGSLATQITIAKVPIQISAKLSTGAGGWEFEGKTAPGVPVNVLDLVNDLGSVFGVQAPTAISKFTLQDIDLKVVSSTDANQPGASSFHFACTGDFTLAGVGLHASVTIDLTRSLAGGYDKNFGGTLTITTASGTIESFTLLFVDDAQGSKLTATWTPSKALTFEDIASAFQFTMPNIPSELDLSLIGAGFMYNFTTGELTFSATSQHYGQLAFASSVVNSQRIYVFDLGVSLNVKLSDLPAVGSQIPPSIDVGIQSIEVAYASAKLAAGDVTAINKNLAAIKAKPLGFPTLDQGVAFFGQMQLGTQQLPLNVPLSSSTATQGGGMMVAGAPAAPASSTAPGKWFDVGKTFGPLQINRVGVQYENSTLTFALDAGITFGPLAFSVDGLGVGSPLTNFSPVFSIRGLGLSYNQPPLEIAGAILKVDNPPAPVKYQFDGMVVLKAATWSLAAIASYAQLTTGESSLFVFAQLQYPIGGPPVFFVTGLMAGFGFNRTLTIPAQDEVDSFPLLLLAATATPGQPPALPTDVLAYLEGTKAPPNGTKKPWITARPGEYWLAAGLMFTSFEIVNTRALLVVEFGDNLLIALLGLSTLQLPQPAESSETYAFVELMIRVVLDPTQGYFSATAILSKNSYVITPDCHLTGGFAFVFWFGSNPNAGQFVITLGGYHPAFKPPDGFPLVPRLGFNWAVSDTVSIKGDAYFALTTSCVMAGGGLEVLFHDGDLQAWFTAHADFLVSWHPFFYLAEIGVSIGASYRLNLLFCHKTISVSLGAQLNLWGPPTGGKVRVDLVVVSFTVSFGSDSAGTQQDPLQWGDFKTLLPNPASVCRIMVNQGLYKTADAPQNSSGKLWVVRAKQFSFTTQSSIPASQLQYGDSGGQLMAVADAGIAIRPMNLTGITSTHTLKIFRNGSPTPVPSTGWTMTAAAPQSVPASLWGAPPSPFTQMPAIPTADVVEGQTSGYAVTAPLPQIGDSRGALPLKLLAEEYLTPPGQAPLAPNVAPTADYLPVFANNTVGLIQQIDTGTASSNRTGLFQALTASALFSGVSDPLPLLASAATHLYSDAPMQQN